MISEILGLFAFFCLTALIIILVMFKYILFFIILAILIKALAKLSSQKVSWPKAFDIALTIGFIYFIIIILIDIIEWII